jgi:hypothetical protein
MGDNRDVGIEFGDLQDDLEAESYPLAADDLLARYGDRRLEHANGSVALGELLEDAPRESYESADDVHQAVLNRVGEYAEGRLDYTDREPNARGEDFEQQSF